MICFEMFIIDVLPFIILTIVCLVLLLVGKWDIFSKWVYKKKNRKKAILVLAGISIVFFGVLLCINNFIFKIPDVIILTLMSAPVAWGLWVWRNADKQEDQRITKTDNNNKHLVLLIEIICDNKKLPGARAAALYGLLPFLKKDHGEELQSMGWRFLRDFSRSFLTYDYADEVFPNLNIKAKKNNVFMAWANKVHSEAVATFSEYQRMKYDHQKFGAPMDAALEHNYIETDDALNEEWDGLFSDDKQYWSLVYAKEMILKNELFKAFERIILDCLANSNFDQDKTYSKDFNYSFMCFNGEKDKKYFSGKSFERCIFTCSEFKNLVEEKITWTDCKFNHSSFINSHFKDNQISTCSNSNVCLHNTCFEKGHMMGLSFLHSTFSLLSFKDMILSGTCFESPSSSSTLLFINPIFGEKFRTEVTFCNGADIILINPEGKFHINGNPKIQPKIYSDGKKSVTEFANRLKLQPEKLTDDILDSLKQKFPKAFDSK